MTDTPDTIQLVLNKREAQVLVGAAMIGLLVVEDEKLADLFYKSKRDESRAFVAQIVTPEMMSFCDMIAMLSPDLAAGLLAREMTKGTDSVRNTVAGIMRALNPQEFTDEVMTRVPPSPFRK